MYPISKALLAAGIVALLGLSAMAADITPQAKTPTAARPVAKPEARGRNQQEWDSMTPEQRMERRKKMREHWEKMSPKEREQVRNKMKDHWKNMSPQEREARRKEMHEHFKNMSPQERKQFKRDMGKQDGMPPPGDELPGGKTDETRHPAK